LFKSYTLKMYLLMEYLYNLVHQGCAVQGWKVCSCMVLQQQFFHGCIQRSFDLGSEWLNYAMNFMVDTKTRDTCFGADVQKLRQDKWPVTHLATYIKCGDTRWYGLRL
jgi:hypothetical protein